MENFWITKLQAFAFILKGVPYTLMYTAVAFFFGALLGSFLAYGLFKKKFLKPIRMYISVLRGTPLVVQLFFMYFLMPHLLGFSLNVMWSCCITLSLNSAAYFSGLILTGLNSVPPGQFEVCHTLGIRGKKMWFDIIIPQILLKSEPSIVNEATSLLKETALVNTVGGTDIMKQAHLWTAQNYDYLTPTLMAASVYYALVLVLEIIIPIILHKIINRTNKKLGLSCSAYLCSAAQQEKPHD